MSYFRVPGRALNKLKVNDGGSIEREGPLVLQTHKIEVHPDLNEVWYTEENQGMYPDNTIRYNYKDCKIMKE